MNESTAATHRVFRLPARDTTGVVAGLSWPGLVAVVVGMVVAAVAIQAGAPVLAAFVPVAVAAGVGYARLGGLPLLSQVPVLARAVRRRRTGRWHAPIPLHQVTDLADVDTAGLSGPDCLAGLELVGSASTGSAETAGMGVVLDRVADTATAVVTVPGVEFALLSRGEQEQRLDGWASVLAGFATEAGPVARLTWTDLATPAGLDDHLHWVDEQATVPASVTVGGSNPRDDYRDLVAAAGPATTTHRCFVAVTVDAARLRADRSRRDDRDGRLIEAVDRAVSGLVRGLHHAGLQPSLPLTGQELADAVRLRVDPLTRPGGGDTHSRLSDRIGLTTVPGPQGTEWAWSSWRTDGSWHRSWWVETWPRQPLGPDWLLRLLSHPSLCRATTVVLEPVSPSRSRRAVERDLARLDADAVVKDEKGRRITALHRRHRDAVTEREEELVAGHAEFGFAGFVTVSASTRDELDAAAGEIEDLARREGLDLRSLDGRHDLGWAVTLPLGIGLHRLSPLSS